MQKKVLVVKLGTAVISDDKGNISTSVIKKLAEEISVLSKTHHIVLVSSGAVGSGRSAFKNYQGTLTERKAAAAVGNPVLIRLYHKYFFKYGITVAQALCERHHFAGRSQFLQLKQTFEEFWRNDILPVVNENDLVSNVELKFSDNDELATLVAVGFNAEKLIICTTVGGLKNAEGSIVPVIEKIDSKVMSFVTKEKTATGLGGMLTKLSSAKLAVSLGIHVIICGLNNNQPLQQALKGSTGTHFLPRTSNLKARQKWLASGSIAPGNVTVDAGAERALKNRKSLLSIGIKSVQGDFMSGEVFQLLNESAEIIGVGKARINSIEMTAQKNIKNSIAAHADDIVLF